MAHKAKKSPFKLDMKTFRDTEDKHTFIVFKRGKEFHAFVEVDAKKAAMDCGSGESRDQHTHTHWRKLWKTKE